MFSNKFAGTCRHCGNRVQAYQGELVKVDGAWKVEHPAGACLPKLVKKAPVEVGSLTGIFELFAKAKSHLKYPAIVLGVPELGNSYGVRVHVAGEKAREPGSLSVTHANLRDTETGRRVYVGKVGLSGHYLPAQGLTETEATAVAATLKAFAANPVSEAKRHAVLIGACMFCNKPLRDERSTAAGYGATCARHWGLPWGERPADFAEKAA